MTPAAMRRLGELGGLLPDSNGNWIDLEALQVDYRVTEIACIALIERTMGKAREYDPAKDPEVLRTQFDVSDPTVRQKVHELIEAATRRRRRRFQTAKREPRAGAGTRRLTHHGAPPYRCRPDM
jgi:hypothetical protein